MTLAFGGSTMGRTQVQLRYNRFKKGREDVNDDARSGRPRTSTTDEYEGCPLYFGIREQKQILIIAKYFIVFQNIPN